jgi:hypothetical protein
MTIGTEADFRNWSRAKASSANPATFLVASFAAERLDSARDKSRCFVQRFDVPHEMSSRSVPQSELCCLSGTSPHGLILL